MTRFGAFHAKLLKLRVKIFLKSRKHLGVVSRFGINVFEFYLFEICDVYRLFLNCSLNLVRLFKL